MRCRLSYAIGSPNSVLRSIPWCLLYSSVALKSSDIGGLGCPLSVLDFDELIEFAEKQTLKRDLLQDPVGQTLVSAVLRCNGEAGRSTQPGVVRERLRGQAAVLYTEANGEPVGAAG